MPAEYGVRLPTLRVPIVLTPTGVRAAAAMTSLRRHPTDRSDRNIRPMRTTPRVLMSFTSQSPPEISFGDPAREQSLLILVVRVGHCRLLLQHILEEGRFQRGPVGHHAAPFLLVLLACSGGCPCAP